MKKLIQITTIYGEKIITQQYRITKDYIYTELGPIPTEEIIEYATIGEILNKERK